MDLPEEIIVNIISRLPVKSLVRFISVSKRWRSIILFDKQFENQLRRNKTLTRRVLVRETSKPPQLGSLDLETASFRWLNFSFPKTGHSASLLGSCNGLVFIGYPNVFHVYNPLTGFVKELPLPRFNPRYVYLRASGFGYIPATDDYKVIVHYLLENASLYEIISLKDQIWRRIEGPAHEDLNLGVLKGTLVNEALHWVYLRNRADADEITAFDLAKEEFRKMKTPNFCQDGNHGNYLGVCLGGRLCLLRYPFYDYPLSGGVDFWVMREYQVSESWTKLYNLSTLLLRPFLITENYTVASICTGNESRWIRISHKQEDGEEPSWDVLHAQKGEEEELSFNILDRVSFHAIEYEESLASIAG